MTRRVHEPVPPWSLLTIKVTPGSAASMPANRQRPDEALPRHHAAADVLVLEVADA
ncbi:hypothetical protein LZG04_38485 [Saccharothrix sp. S26]|uniref:hypothetical protein n=1 Tax=Saccharothrix sp. S26 TaxID=2907215 RepID=UPI001F33B68F|nr:hypothetical protein [Saccharothrix sp. S26]MCE7000664.1 hypothetical protein [Saccharothrix sp. S26]